MVKGLCGHSSDKSVILDGSAEHCWEHATSIRNTGKEAEVKSSHTAQFIHLHFFNWQHFYLKHLNSSGEAKLQNTELSNCGIRIVFQKPCSGSLAVLAFQLPEMYLLLLVGYKIIFHSQNSLFLHFTRAPSSGTATTSIYFVKELFKSKICNLYSLGENFNLITPLGSLACLTGGTLSLKALCETYIRGPFTDKYKLYLKPLTIQ